MLLPVGVLTPFAGSCAGWQQVAHDCSPAGGCMHVGIRRRRNRHKQTPTPTNGAVDVSSWQEAVDDEMGMMTETYRGGRAARGSISGPRRGIRGRGPTVAGLGVIALAVALGLHVIR